MTDSNAQLQAELEQDRKNHPDVTDTSMIDGLKDVYGHSVEKAIRDSGLNSKGEALDLVEKRATTYKPSLKPSTMLKFTGLAPLVDSLSSRNTAKTVSDNLGAISEAKTKTFRAIAEIDEQMTKLFDERNRLLGEIDDLSRSEAILTAANNEANSPRWRR